MADINSTVSVEWLDDCPKCGGKTAIISGNGYRTTSLLKSGDVAECSACGHVGEIDADGENAWVEWENAEDGSHE